jgi:hypothetical protein
MPATAFHFQYSPYGRGTGRKARLEVSGPAPRAGDTPYWILKKQARISGVSRGRGLAFSGKIDHAFSANRLLRQSGVGVRGGGWLLVEMCIVDASILFICDYLGSKNTLCF